MALSNANGCYWEAKPGGAGGVARSKGKEVPFWGLPGSRPLHHTHGGLLSFTPHPGPVRARIALFPVPDRPVLMIFRPVCFGQLRFNPYWGNGMFCNGKNRPVRSCLY